MFEQYPDILTVEEVCEALRMGFNAVVRVGRKSPRSGRTEMTNPVKKKSPTALVGDLWV